VPADALGSGGLEIRNGEALMGLPVVADEWTLIWCAGQ